jgi:hypothetical protein
MAQELYRPSQRTPAEHRSADQRLSEVKILDDSINSLREKVNLFDRMIAHRRAGKNAASVIVAMQRDVAEAQREVVQHHANLLARSRKMELTDRFQASLMDLTRRVEERTSAETAHYWKKLTDRENYYEEFFETRIKEIKQKIAAGEMTEVRGAERISRYEHDRDQQQAQDRMLLQEIMGANERVMRKALADYQPT